MRPPPGAWERASELSASPEERGRRLAEAATDAWLTGLMPEAARLLAAAEPLVADPVLLANCCDKATATPWLRRASESDRIGGVVLGTT